MGILDFFTGGGEYADPNAIDERYGVSKGDVRQAALNTLGNVSGLLLAAGQPMSGSQRAQLLGQLGPAFGGAQTDIYNAAQRRLLGAENEQKMAEMQQMKSLADEMKDPAAFAAKYGFNPSGLPPQTVRDILTKQLTTRALETDVDRKVSEMLRGGGQNVNKVETAVRLKHIPSGFIVECQQARTQGENRELALKMLKSRLYEEELRKRQEALNASNANKKKIEWGSQIRSYVFHPYKMIKDHRTDFEVGNVGPVMDGEIDGFIKAYLMMLTEDAE